MSYSEAQRLRLADDQAVAEQSRAMHQGDGGAVTVLAVTTTLGAYPTSAARFYVCGPLDVLGTETEGSSGVTSSAGGSILALNTGSGIPPNGTQVVVTFVGNRWVFRYDS